MVYKIVTKVISNRLKTILPLVILDTQRAFTPGRLITDNILVAFELFHYMNDHNGSNGGMMLKLDMSIAFDKVEWSFREGIMLHLRFVANWV